MRADFLAPGRRRARLRWLAAAGVVASSFSGLVLLRPWELLPNDQLRSLAIFGGNHRSSSEQLRPLQAKPTELSEPAVGNGSSMELEAAADATPDDRSAAARTETPRPLRQLLLGLAARAGLGLVVEAAVDGQLVATDAGSGVPWRHALQAYCRVAGLVFQVDQGLIEVRRAKGSEVPGELLPRQDSAESDWDSLPVAGLPVVEPVVVNDTRIYRFLHADAAAVVDSVRGSVIGTDLKLTADSAANALVLHGPPSELDRLMRVVVDLDRPRRRVLLEVKILELSRSAREALGAEWTLGGDIGAQVNLGLQERDGESGALVIATSGGHPLSLRLAALEADGKVRIVSQPKVVVLEGSTAKIESVRILRIRLPDSNAIVADDGAVGSIGLGRATEEVPVGVSLQVQPSVRAGSRIHLKIAAKSSNLGPPLPPDGIPEELSRTVDVEIEVAAGTTALLGGLSREGTGNSRSAVPILGRIPLLGILFRKRSHERDHEELLILVTPTLVEDPLMP